MPWEKNDPNAPPITSSCHCGSIQITFPRPTAPLNECGCSVCYRYGCMWAYYQLQDIKIEIKEGCTRDKKTGKVILPGQLGPLSTSPSASDYASGEKLMREGVDKMKVSHEAEKTDKGEKQAVDENQGRGPGCESYLWAAKMVDFCRCAHCGCVTHWLLTRPWGDNRMGINCRMLGKDVLDTLEKRYTPIWD